MMPSFDPIAPWPVIALAAAAIAALTLWAYRKRLRGTTGAWRWFALGLRLVAVLLCVLAALRPSMLIQKKQKQEAAVVFLVDASRSMSLGDEVGGLTRVQSAEKALREAVAAVGDLGPEAHAKVYQFDEALREHNPDEPLKAEGRLTGVGNALEEGARRNESMRVLRYIVLGDGASNTGPDPRAIARSLGSRQSKVDAVGFGSESAETGSKDIAVLDLVTNQFAYAKTEMEVSARIDARGYPGEELEVELVAEGRSGPKTVRRATLPVPPGRTEILARGLKWTPEEPGETKLTLRVKPKPGELIATNNETSTYVSVLKGGIGVLYLTGYGSPWEKRFLTWALDASEKIQLTTQVFTEPATRDLDAEIRGGKYDVFILGDLPAEFLSRDQQRLLAEAVSRGAGLMMLGGRNSFGPGGWGGTPVGEVLPVEMHPGDRQIEPERGLKVVPNERGLDSYILKVGPGREETRRIWSELPNIGGANQVVPKQAASVLALAEGTGEPIMATIEPNRGRSIAFAGETWPWYRASEESQRAHLNFWRNAILWLARKEDEGDTQIRLALDRRRVALGQKLGVTAEARDGKGDPIPGVEIKATLAREATDPDPAPAEGLQLFRQGDAWLASHFATGEPGEYRIEVAATRDGQAVGTASARFIVYDDDRELRNPAADLSLLRSLARESGGEFLPPENLAKHIRSLADEVVADYVTQNEVRLWDNWPFLLAFTVVLSAEWWLRKRNGWV